MLTGLQFGEQVISAGSESVTLQKTLKGGTKFNVFLGVDPDGRPVVVKESKSSDPMASMLWSCVQDSFELAQQEPTALQHAHIAPFRHVDDHIAVADYVPGTDLCDVMSNISFTMDQIRSLLKAVSVHLNTLRSAGITHRDIKPENLILAHPTQPLVPENVFIIDSDFLTRVTGKRDEYCQGTVQHMAPEQVQGYTSSTLDGYGLGMTAFSLLPYDILQYIFSVPWNVYDKDYSAHALFRANIENRLFRPDAFSRLEKYFLPTLPGSSRRTVRAILNFAFASTAYDPLARPQTVQESHQMLEDTGNILEI